MLKIKKHYINVVIFQKEIIISKGRGKLTVKAEKMLLDLCDGLSYKFRIRYVGKNLHHFDDIKQHIYLDIFSKWGSINVKKYDNPFAYYTEVIKRSWADGYSKIVLKKPNNKTPSIEYISISGINLYN